MKKFELTTEQKINWFGHTLYRIKACISFTTTNGLEVNEGDLGGWVEKESNLSHIGKAWVWGNAEVCGNANLFSTEHILCVTPIGEYANSLTLFRTKKCEIKVSFELEIYDLEEFKEIVADWDDTKQREVALAALELGQKHIDLTPTKKPNFKDCPFCNGKAEYNVDSDVVVCSECGASADKKFWNNRV